MLISVVTEKTRPYLFNDMNFLVLISCSWLLKKTLVMTTNLTNPKSVSDLSVLFVSICYIFRFLVFQVSYMRSFQMKIKAIKFII